MAENTNDRGAMTTREAGKKGGDKVAQERGKEFYSDTGHKGGERVRELVEEGKQSEDNS